MATTREGVVEVPASRIKNIFNTILAGCDVRQDKGRLFAICDAGFNLKVLKIYQGLVSYCLRFDVRKRWQPIIQAIKKLMLLIYRTFDRNDYAIRGVCNPAILLVLLRQSGNKWTKTHALNETGNFNLYMIFTNRNTFFGMKVNLFDSNRHSLQI